MSTIEQTPIPQCVGNYDLGKTIGNGKFGKVKIGTHVLTGEKVAIKIVKKNRIDKDGVPLVYREINIMKLLKLLDHPNIIKLYEIVELENVVFMIMEYAAGGEILDYLITHGKLPEREAKRFFAQVVSAMQYCHKLHVIHRDLKAENLLLDANCNIKIIDFGLSNAYVPGELMKTFCGSPTYAAPELIHRKNYVGPPVDVWSMGVLLYVLVCGKLPFEGADLRSLLLKSVNAEYTIPGHVSFECSELIRCMLVVDPEERATLEEICRHPWLRGTSVYVPSPNMDTELRIEKINAEQSSNRKNNTTINSKNMPVPTITESDLSPSLVAELANLFNLPPQSIVEEILTNTYGSISATYYLFVEKYGRETNLRDIGISTNNLSGINSQASGVTSNGSAKKPPQQTAAEEPKQPTSGFRKGHRRTRTSDATIPINDAIQQTPSQHINIHTTTTHTVTPPNSILPSKSQTNQVEAKPPVKPNLSSSQRVPDPTRLSINDATSQPPTESPRKSIAVPKPHKTHRRNVSVGIPAASNQGSKLIRPGFSIHKPFIPTSSNEKTLAESTKNVPTAISGDQIDQSTISTQGAPQTVPQTSSQGGPPTLAVASAGGPPGAPGGKPFKRGHYRHKSEGLSLINEESQKKSPVESFMSVFKMGFGNLWKHQQHHQPGVSSPLTNSTTNPGNLTERTRRDTGTESDEVRATRFAFSASTTSTSSPSALISQVKRVLNDCYINFTESANFCLECTAGDIVFEIEVCRLPGLTSVYGLKMKRISGDSWDYKSICSNLITKLKLEEQVS